MDGVTGVGLKFVGKIKDLWMFRCLEFKDETKLKMKHQCPFLSSSLLDMKILIPNRLILAT